MCKKENNQNKNAVTMTITLELSGDSHSLKLLQIFFFIHLGAIFSFSALVVTEDKKQVRRDIAFSDLLKAAGDTKDQKGRVSTGTKFALEEWLSLQCL